MTSDWELLGRYAARGDQAAFAELVGRHVDMVYRAARRILGEPRGGKEEDVVQAVFLLLSQKADRIGRRGALAGWLFHTTRYCCRDVLKKESRRRKYEREAAMAERHGDGARGRGGDLGERRGDAALGGRGDEEPAEVLGLLDDALRRLGEKERQAILVRYLEGKTTEETSAVLGLSTEAVKKRLERGIGKLRRIFERKGYTVPAAALVALVLGESAKAAPAGLRSSAAAVTGGASVTAAGIAQGAAAMMQAAVLKFATATSATVLLVACAAFVVAGRTGNPPAEATSPTAPADAATLRDLRAVIRGWQENLAQIKTLQLKGTCWQGKGDHAYADVKGGGSGDATAELAAWESGESLRTELVFDRSFDFGGAGAAPTGGRSQQVPLVLAGFSQEPEVAQSATRSVEHEVVNRGQAYVYDGAAGSLRMGNSDGRRERAEVLFRMVSAGALLHFETLPAFLDGRPGGVTRRLREPDKAPHIYTYEETWTTKEGKPGRLLMVLNGDQGFTMESCQTWIGGVPQGETFCRYTLSGGAWVLTRHEEARFDPATGTALSRDVFDVDLPSLRVNVPIDAEIFRAETVGVRMGR